MTQEAHKDGPVQGESPPAFLKALAQFGIDPQEVIGFLDQLIARQINGMLKQAKLPETIQALQQQAQRMEAALHQAPVAAATEAPLMAGAQAPPGQNGAAMTFLEILAKAMTKDETAVPGLQGMATQFAQMGQLMSAMWKGVMEPMAEMETQATKRVLDTMGAYYKTGGDFPWSGGGKARAPAPDSAAVAHELAKRITVGEKGGS